MSREALKKTDEVHKRKSLLARIPAVDEEHRLKMVLKAFSVCTMLPPSFQSKVCGCNLHAVHALGLQMGWHEANSHGSFVSGGYGSSRGPKVRSS